MGWIAAAWCGWLRSIPGRADVGEPIAGARAFGRLITPPRTVLEPSGVDACPPGHRHSAQPGVVAVEPPGLTRVTVR
jgi:hypothetical protein